MPHPSYSPNLTPSNSFCFPNEEVLKGKCFANVEEVKQKMAEALKSIKIKFKNFWAMKSLDRCIASSGEYFEDDSFKHVRISTQFFINSSFGGFALVDGK